MARVLIQEMELEYNTKSSILEQEDNADNSNMLLSLAVHGVDIILISILALNPCGQPKDRVRKILVMLPKKKKSTLNFIL